MIYLDNAATTPTHPDVLKAMMPYLTTEYGNAGTIYSLGRNAAKAIKNAREQVANFIGASPEQIIFTSGGSEANSMVFHGIADYLCSIGKTKILISAAEHDSVIKAAKALERPMFDNNGKKIKSVFDIEFIRVTSYGNVDIKHLQSLLDKGDVGLVSIMYENNEVGAVNPVCDISRICTEAGALFHTDCVQAAGWQRIDAAYINCDFLSLSSHKIHGTKGTGALYIKDKSKMSPIINGGASQEYGLRGGTENVAGIVGFGKACTIVSELREGGYITASLKNLFFTTLTSNIGLKDFVHVNGASVNAPGKTLNLRFSNIDAETLILMLDTEGVCVSAGSACRSHESEPSHVLLAMGLTPDEARDSIRISFSTMNTSHEVVKAAKLFAKCISTLKAIW